MNRKMIRKKLEEYYKTSTPEQVIEEFENLGVEFEDSIDKQILEKYYPNEFPDNADIYKVMREYAIIMCKKQRQICLDEAKLLTHYDWVIDMCRPAIVKNSILKATLPEELKYE